MTTLPEDDNGNWIPALRLKGGGAHTVSVSAASARTAQDFDAKTRVISLYSTVDIFVSFGGGNVTASSADHFLPAGIYYDVAIGAGGQQYKRLAAIRAGDEDGTLYISEKE